MVDSAASPVDGPTKLEQREAADREPSEVQTLSDDDRYNSPTERQAQNVRDYHQSEINRLSRAIGQHQAIVDAQDEILSHPSSRPADEPLDNGTDIGEIFDKSSNAPDADPEANVSTGDADADSSNAGNPDGTGEGSGTGEGNTGRASPSSDEPTNPNRPLSGTSGLTGPDADKDTDTDKGKTPKKGR